MSSKQTSHRLAPLKYFFLTLFCQLLGSVIASAAENSGLPFVALFGIHSLVSGGCSVLFQMSTPWRFLNFIIPAGILISITFPGYGWIWLILMVVFGLLFLPTFWTRVPYFPSSEKTYSLIANQLPADTAFRFLDIGCGDGKLLCALAAQFPKAQFEGIDLSPTAVLFAKLKSRASSNVKIIFGDYWRLSFADYDFIYAFLSPTPMAKIEAKAQAELRFDALLIVNSFALPNWSADRELLIEDKNQSLLFLYRKATALS